MSTSNARKRAARNYQARFPGTSYPAALRAVSHQDASRPLTAAVGRDQTGKAVRVNLEEAVLGGHGPHLAILGPTGAGRTCLLVGIAQSLLESPPGRGLELITASPKSDFLLPALSPSITRNYTAIGPVDGGGFVSEMSEKRTAQLRANNRKNYCDGDSLFPAAVVMIDGFECFNSDAILRGLRVGRSLDIHLIVTVNAAAHDFWEAPREFRDHHSMLNAHIAVDAPQRGQGILRHGPSGDDGPEEFINFEIPFYSAAGE